MLTTIYKYPLDMITGVTQIELPMNYVVVYCHLDATKAPCIWIKLDPEDGDKETVTFQIIGTGSFVTAPWIHVGSMYQDGYIWHVGRVE